MLLSLVRFFIKNRPLNHNRHINARACLMTEKGIVTGVEQMGGACSDRLSACPCIRTARNMKAMKHILKQTTMLPQPYAGITL